MSWRLRWRKFVHGEGHAKKCWNVALGVDYVATRTGCFESRARTRMRWFPDNDKASAWLLEQIEGKLNKGYVELTRCRENKAAPRLGESKRLSAGKKTNRKSVVWKRIEKWLSEHSHDGSIPLPSGASESEIRKSEGAIDAKLPPDVQSSYAVHDGSGNMAFANGGRLLSLTEMVNFWLGFKKGRSMGYYKGRSSKPTGPIKPDWYNPLWIPVCTNEEGDFVLLDLDPAPKGAIAQDSRTAARAIVYAACAGACSASN